MTFGLVGMTVPSLAGIADSISSKIRRQSLHERFTEEAVTFLQQILLLIQQMCIGAKVELELLNSFSKVIVCDSSWWEICEKLKDIFPGFGGGSSEAHCKLQLAYDLLKGQIDSFCITEGTKNDSVYAHELVDKLCQGALLLVDLGYASARFFASIHEKGIYFVSKLKSDFKIFHPDSKKTIDLLKTLKKIETNSFELNILLGLNQGVEIPCRLIGEKVPKEVAQRRRQKCRETARRKRGYIPKRLTLELCGWTLMITNIPKDLIPANKVLVLYRIRWQIELIFKQFKSILQIDRSYTSNENRLLCEIYGRLIAATIITKLHGSINSNIWNSQNLELSLEKFFKRMQERAFTLMIKLLDSVKSAIDFLYKEIKNCLANCIKLVQRSRLTPLGKLNDTSYAVFKRIPQCILITLS